MGTDGLRNVIGGAFEVYMWLKWDLLDISGCTRVILRPLYWIGEESALPLPRKLQVEELELDQLTRG